jgi:hypothetical protein
MAQMIDRSVEARTRREPDLFLSHSSRDKVIVRRLAEDLSFLEVDAWLDEWELQTGDSLHDVLAAAMEKAGHIAVVLGDNYADSRWARDELKQALARERRQDQDVILPLIVGAADVPAFLEDKLYLDFRRNYHEGLSRLAGIVHKISRKRIEDAISVVQPKKISHCIKVLRYCGFEPYVVIGDDDWSEIKAEGGIVVGERVRFDPESVASHPKTSPRIRQLMKRLQDEVWTSDSYW